MQHHPGPRGSGMEPVDQHPPHLMPPSPPQVLFFGEFRPKEGGEVDEVRAGNRSALRSEDREEREREITVDIHTAVVLSHETDTALPTLLRFRMAAWFVSYFAALCRCWSKSWCTRHRAGLQSSRRVCIDSRTAL